MQAYAHVRCVKSMFTNIKKQQNMLKLTYFLRNLQTSRANNLRILKVKNVKFSVYCFYLITNIYGGFQICISVPLNKRNQWVKIHLTLNSFEITEHSVQKSSILGPLLWVNIILSSSNTWKFSFYLPMVLATDLMITQLKRRENLLTKLYNK